MINYYRGAVADFVKKGCDKKDVIFSAVHHLSIMQAMNILPFVILFLYWLDRLNEKWIIISVIVLVVALHIINIRIARRIDVNIAFEKKWHHLIKFTRRIVLAQMVVSFLSTALVTYLITPAA
ncbi:hypothetical protein [Glaciecola sp. 1036]|uniref:hypothetical protein n=1 Tax=Alteromonadaceae TaxID=72275 RepID=UPI003D05F341